MDKDARDFVVGCVMLAVLVTLAVLGTIAVCG